MRRPAPLAVYCAAAIIALLAPTIAFGQAEPPQSSVRGENFSAKPAPALFASDCTGAGCHKGPQGLGKRMGLAGFLREHYTNSRESAAALANYLTSLPPERAARQTPQTPARGSRAATRTDEDAVGDRPAQGPQRSRRATETPEPPETVPPGASRGRRIVEPAEPPAKPAPRGQRGRQATAVPIPPAPEPAEISESVEPAAEAAPAPPPAQVFDIFD
jgi:hypothetical protein